MRKKSLSTACGLLAMCFIGLIGCGKGKSNAPVAGQAPAHHHHHDHGMSRGPHGGQVIGLDIESYHVELTHDPASHHVGVYLLGEDAATAAPIEAASVTIDASVGDTSEKYTLPAVAQPGEAAGKSSYFELVSEPLDTVVSGQSGSPIGELQFNVTIAGKPQVGTIGLQDLGDALANLGGGSATSDDILLWLKQINEQGYDLSLGHHGSSLLAGSQVEPAVQITREGKPVADAKVFNSLLDSDSHTILAEEVATVYEPPAGDEPSHYAQGSLKIPSGTRQAILRYRIILPEGRGEHTYDVPVAVK